jgi:hypothetical protein
MVYNEHMLRVQRYKANSQYKQYKQHEHLVNIGGQLYEPELGQMLFGQSHQEYECGSYLLVALETLSCLFSSLYDRPNPFSNTGERYDSEIFSVHAYSWGDEEQPWNFQWQDIEVSWYKYLARGTTCNRPVTQSEAQKLTYECVRHFLEQYKNA